jgi:hypothetical protein
MLHNADISYNVGLMHDFDADSAKVAARSSIAASWLDVITGISK